MPLPMLGDEVLDRVDVDILFARGQAILKLWRGGQLLFQKLHRPTRSLAGKPDSAIQRWAKAARLGKASTPLLLGKTKALPSRSFLLAVVKGNCWPSTIAVVPSL